VILNNLFKQTSCRIPWRQHGRLLDGQPRVLKSQGDAPAFLAHRREWVTRARSTTCARPGKKRISRRDSGCALNVDEIIELIKKIPDSAEAKVALMAKSWRSPVVEEMLKRAAAAPRGRGPGTGIRLA